MITDIFLRACYIYSMVYCRCTWVINEFSFAEGCNSKKFFSFTGKSFISFIYFNLFSNLLIWAKSEELLKKLEFIELSDISEDYWTGLINWWG